MTYASFNKWKRDCQDIIWILGEHDIDEVSSEILFKLYDVMEEQEKERGKIE